LPAQLSRLLVLARLTPCCDGCVRVLDEPARDGLNDNIGLGLTGVQLFVLPAAAALLSRLGLTDRRRNR
jgi:hypothetical protein